MRTQEEEIAIRKIVIHLSRTCMDNGFGVEVFRAFESAKPDLAHQHLRATGGSVIAASAALCLDESDDDDEVLTVFTKYLFQDPDEQLKSVSQLCESIEKMRALALARQAKKKKQ